ncbi:sugar transferase [Christiangramia flava]|uniref:Lipid carrier: UDP-N-acetylgalactosaminyltransferase n=1 Tax=Christiangramia flava JLT2011 TaxID=1229726 RepID=A0A1L7HZN6_9FLAO|nr:sugar transferase [Christiangramia flava]APU66800.1 Lipid carrier : UDP-N-acetylgalactosaminyltransferase [Christiangramia flava JLT2011]OSS38437.1 Lipid carrier : UDP-N-acetylgalactosaminyltransferase [Christiangramia flava JLT2011]
MYRSFFKPLIDFLAASIGFLLLSPLFLVFTVLLAIVNKGTPFFYQQRPGLHGRIFKIIKFKTMTDAKDASGKLKPDAERLTMIGRIVRKTSMDEIPQLLNVIKGDMSLVGPRPLLPQYLDIYTPRQARRHEVKPGITGWAQVNGRNAISWTKKFELDIWYVEHISFSVDLQILFKTVRKVLISEGINTGNMATTEPFNGRN